MEGSCGQARQRVATAWAAAKGSKTQEQGVPPEGEEATRTVAGRLKQLRSAWVRKVEILLALATHWDAQLKTLGSFEPADHRLYSRSRGSLANSLHFVVARKQCVLADLGPFLQDH